MPHPYSPEPEAEGQALDLHRLFQFVRRRWRAIGTTGALIFVAGFFYVWGSPRVYEAMAKVAVERPPEVLDIGKDVVSRDLEINPDRAIQAVISLVQSDSVLAPVVDTFPPPEDDDEFFLNPLLRTLKIRGPKPAMSPIQQKQAQIKQLRKFLKLERDGAGTVLAVTFTSRSSEDAALTANAVADSLVNYRQRQRELGSKKAADWLKERSVTMRERIEEREKELAVLVRTTGIVPSDTRKQSFETSSRPRLATDLQNARIDLYASNQRLSELDSRMKGAGSKQSTAGGAVLRDQFSKAQAQLDEARLVYTPTHPEVRRLETIVEGLRGQLGPNARAEMPLDLQEEMREYRALKADRARLAARVAVLERAATDLDTREASKSGSVAKYERLERELAVDRQMYETLLMRLNQTVLTAVTENHGTRILDYAVPPVSPAGPSKPKLLIVVLALSIAGGIGMAIVRELLDRHVHNTDDAVDVLGAPILGYIPTVRDRSNPAERQSQATNRSVAGEAYRNLRTALLFSVGNADLSCLAITSAIAGEGKTTVSSNLAATFAEAGRRVVLVDGDLRRPRVNRVFALQRAPGLAEVIQGTVPLEEAVERPVGCSFDILTSGSIPENPSELLASPEFEGALADMRSAYDLVLIDCAVMLAVSDALLVASRANGTIVVQRPGTVEKRALEQMRSDFDRAGARVLGIVFNQVDRGNSYVYPSYLESPYVTGGTSSSGLSRFKRKPVAPAARKDPNARRS